MNRAGRSRKHRANKGPNTADLQMCAEVAGSVLDRKNRKTMIRILVKLQDKHVKETTFYTRIITEFFVKCENKECIIDRENTTIMMRLQYLHLYLLLFPAEFFYKEMYASSMYVLFCLSMCDLYKHSITNVRPEFIETAQYLVGLTETISIKSIEFNVNWSSYYRCKVCGGNRVDFVNMQNPALVCLAWRYKCTRSQIATVLDLYTTCRCRNPYDKTSN